MSENKLFGAAGPLISTCKDMLNPECWTSTFFPKLKETNNLTNALLIGVDTRDGNSGLMNTDTIIVASYNHTTGKTLLVSFPRDLYVPYKVNGRGPYYQKVNAVYAAGELSNQKNGMEVLKSNIEGWLDIEIHYTGKVNFNTVTEVVDDLGGIDITLAKDYVDVYPYSELSPALQQTCSRATDLPQYCVFKFNAGVNHFDGEHALIYARMRQYTSDFDRARRQQEVIDAAKSKFLSGDESTLDKAKYAWKLFETVRDEDNVEASITYNDILGGLFILDKADLNPINVVLDPSFGNGKYLVATSVPMGGVDAYVVKVLDPTFANIRAELELIQQNPGLYEDKAKVVISNQSGIAFTPSSKALKLKEEGVYFNQLTYITQPKSLDYGIKILVFNNKPETIKYLQSYFDTQSVIYNPVEAGFSQSGFKEDIKVIVNPDSELTSVQN